MNLFSLYFDQLSLNLTFAPAGGITTTTTYWYVGRTINIQNYLFRSHFHPYAARLVDRLIEKSIGGLQSIDTEYAKNADGSTATLPGGKPRPVLYEDIFSSARYTPANGLVAEPPPVKELDFDSSGAYAVYNWELFFHVPLTIAVSLSKNQRFAEAQKWFHYIFDPTDDSDGATPERFWKVLPFRTTTVKRIEEILVNLATGEDEDLRRETIDCINQWLENPFRPHLVARYRPSAYMLKTVTAYLDNLIAWGDALFRQDSRESINEAMQLYVLAANILGPKPQEVPTKGSIRPRTYANIRSDLDKFGNFLTELETDIPFVMAPPPAGAAEDEGLLQLASIGQVLYFCIPKNEKLIAYWDTVADRLFKIRNSLNIQGVFRQLPFFEPPIDPALLAKAAAAGLDVGAVASGANQPLPAVRFQILAQKAAEICQEVKSLGNNLLSAMEKEDNEALSVLRARHERVILAMAESVKYAQWQEAVKSREGIEQSMENTIKRYAYYEMLLGKKEEEIKIPEMDKLDRNELEKFKLKAREPLMPQRRIEVDVAGDLDEEGGGKYLSASETEELAKLKKANDKQKAAGVKEKIGAAIGLLPDLQFDGKPFGIGLSLHFGIGTTLSRAMSFWASFDQADASEFTYEASKTAKIGSYSRREQEWAFQSNSAAGEIAQMLKQLRAAQIREYIAEKEWKNHRQQMKHAEEIERFLTGERGGKKTNQGFYAWMKREAKGLYADCFQFAYDVAKKAERALQHELGDETQKFLQFGYLEGKEGLLAGEKLYIDIKRMEMSYLELNRREYELTKHVSLLQVNPVELLKLRTMGECSVSLPEELFDMDCPGHYFRRIKSVALSIPCVTGPYTSLNCTLTLVKSAVRKSALLRDGKYERLFPEDDRFSDNFGALEAVVTSTGQNDSGMFETNLHDERRLPFEGSGAASEWRLKLPADWRQFDYQTISDVILHVRYTAREGGELLRGPAIANLKTKIAAAWAEGCARLFSIRHEFPDAWHRFIASKPATPGEAVPLRLELREEHYPFWSKGGAHTISDVYCYVRKNGAATIQVTDGAGKTDTLVKDRFMNGVFGGRLVNIPKPAFTGQFTLNFSENAFEDLWIIVSWSKPAT